MNKTINRFWAITKNKTLTILAEPKAKILIIEKTQKAPAIK